MNIGAHSKPSFADDLSRLARFGANISDAYGCFIFLPENVLKSHGASGTSAQGDLLRMAGFHSLSNDVITDSALATDSGLIGWVAKHGRSIHVSPFERDSRTLGIYSVDQQLKSFIGIPIALGRNAADTSQLSGVIACDSRKAFAFSKLQGKLLEELAEQITFVVRLIEQNSTDLGHTDWHRFRHLGEDLAQALGIGAIDALRVRIKNFAALEMRHGPQGLSELTAQMVRLIQQALPPHSPLTQLPNGDLLLLIDNMMTSFYEGRINAIADHLSGALGKIELEFYRNARKKRRVEPPTIDSLIAETVPHIELPAKATVDATPTAATKTSILEKSAYEFRRA